MNIFTIAAMKTVYITLEQETIFYIQTYVTGGKNYTNEQLTKILEKGKVSINQAFYTHV